MSRSSKGWLGALALVLSLIGVGVYLFEWNMLRGPIAKRVEKATGRSFAINGDLHVHLSRTPRITADNLVLGNAPWAKEATMAEIGRLDFTIDPFALWRGHVVLPQL